MYWLIDKNTMQTYKNKKLLINFSIEYKQYLGYVNICDLHT